MEPLFMGFGAEVVAKGVLSFGHLIGLVLGLGTTVYLDGGCFLSIVRGSWEGYRSFMTSGLFRIATKFVMVGLGLLWITGCGFLIHYSVFDPGKLANPKLYAKFAFVIVLTVNGYLLHYVVLQKVVTMVECGQLLRSRIGPLCLFSGAVSSASWIGAFLLGALPMLNNTLAFAVFVAAWAMLVLTLYLTCRVVIALAARRERPAPAPLPEAIGSRDLEAILAHPTPAHAIIAVGQGGIMRHGESGSHRPTPRRPRPSKAALPG